MDKAQWAINLLREPMWQEINKFAMSDYSDAEVREQAYIRLRALESIETYLDGIAAQKMIDEKRMKIL